MTKHELQTLFIEAINNVKKLGIELYPIQTELEYTRSLRVPGVCTTHSQYRKRTYCVISFSEHYLNLNEAMIKDIIYHEIAHAAVGAKNHEKSWQVVANKINKALGTNIQAKARLDQLIDKNGNKVGIHTKYKYKVACPACGNYVLYMRKTDMVKYPHMYNCTCGTHIPLVVEQNKEKVA